MSSRHNRKAGNIGKTYVAFHGIPITPDTLHEISLRQPSMRTMRNLVRQAYLRDCPSPAFVDAIISSLSDYHGSINIIAPTISDENSHGDTRMVTPSPITSSSPIVSNHMYEVLSIDQIPGKNEFMSGALLPRLWQPTIPMNDKLDCSTELGDQVQHMPWRILDARSLVNIPGLFQEPELCFHLLGEEFFITVVGLWRAYIEFQDISQDYPNSDTLLLGALARRGGVVSDDARNHDVIYPEDMVSIIAEESDLCDEEYWTELRKQGQIWQESFQDIEFWHGEDKPYWACDPVHLRM